MTGLCYGTDEYNKISMMCRKCSDYIECGKVNPKEHKEKKKVIKKVILEN